MKLFLLFSLLGMTFLSLIKKLINIFIMLNLEIICNILTKISLNYESMNNHFVLTNNNQINPDLFWSKSICSFTGVNASVLDLNWSYFEIPFLGFESTKWFRLSKKCLWIVLQDELFFKVSKKWQSNLPRPSICLDLLSILGPVKTNRLTSTHGTWKF